MSTKVSKMESRWPDSNWLSKVEKITIIRTCRGERPQSKQNKASGFMPQNPRSWDGTRYYWKEWIRGGIFALKNTVLHDPYRSQVTSPPSHQQEIGQWLWRNRTRGFQPWTWTHESRRKAKVKCLTERQGDDWQFACWIRTTRPPFLLFQNARHVCYSQSSMDTNPLE